MISYEKYPMPPNWEIKYDFATKKHFFVNHKTKITTWEDPRKEIFDKDDSNGQFINRNDFLEDNTDIDSVIKVLNQEDDLDSFVQKLKNKYPTISDEIIKDVFKKSKGNCSNAEVLLRQETRKETGSILSNSTINSGSSINPLRCNENNETRFSLTKRSKYQVPESSKDRIKFKLRQEFADVDIRIVDRVLEITDYSLEKSRKIISKSITELPYSRDQDSVTSAAHKESNILPSKSESNFNRHFKQFVSRRSNNEPEVICDKDPPNQSRKTLAVGPNPKNFQGAKVKNSTRK